MSGHRTPPSRRARTDLCAFFSAQIRSKPVNAGLTPPTVLGQIADMTLRQIIQDLDKEWGRSADLTKAANKFAAKAALMDDDFLDKEVPAEEIESVKNQIREARKEAKRLFDQFRKSMSAVKN